MKWVFCFNDTAATEIYTLSLHDALPISAIDQRLRRGATDVLVLVFGGAIHQQGVGLLVGPAIDQDRKRTRLNSSHANISYAVFCLKKKTNDGPHLFLAYPSTRLTSICHI